MAGFPLESGLFLPGPLIPVQTFKGHRAGIVFRAKWALLTPGAMLRRTRDRVRLLFPVFFPKSRSG